MLLFLKNKKFYSSVKPAKHFVGPRKGTSPARRLLQTMRLLELIQNREKAPGISPGMKGWVAKWLLLRQREVVQRLSCDFIKSDEFAIGNGGRREGPLWISNSEQCPVQQPPKEWDRASKDGQKEKIYCRCWKLIQILPGKSAYLICSFKFISQSRKMRFFLKKYVY